MFKRIISALAFSLLLCFSIPAASAEIPSRYDLHFIKYSHMYLPGKDWRLLKAQCWQESRFDPDAVSPVGAMGVCQFMPFTWKDTERLIKIEGNPYTPHLNIQFAAYYMNGLYTFWKWPRPEADRASLALASYNAGAGNIAKAQRKCGNKSLYSEIIPCLPQVTGHHSKETMTYVDRIWNYWTRLVINGK